MKNHLPLDRNNRPRSRNAIGSSNATTGST